MTSGLSPPSDILSVRLQVAKGAHADINMDGASVWLQAVRQIGLEANSVSQEA